MTIIRVRHPANYIPRLQYTCHSMSAVCCSDRPEGVSERAMCVCVLLRTRVATNLQIFTVWGDEEGEVTEKY